MRTKVVPPNSGRWNDRSPPPGERKTVGALRLKESKASEVADGSTEAAGAGETRRGPRSIRIARAIPPRVPFFDQTDPGVSKTFAQVSPAAVALSPARVPILEPEDDAADMNEPSLLDILLSPVPAYLDDLEGLFHVANEEDEVEDFPAACQSDEVEIAHVSFQVSAITHAVGRDSGRLDIYAYVLPAEEEDPNATDAQTGTRKRKRQPCALTPALSTAVEGEPSHEDPAIGWYPPNAPSIGNTLEDDDSVLARRADGPDSSLSSGDDNDEDRDSSSDEDDGNSSEDDEEQASREGEPDLRFVLEPVPVQILEAGDPRAKVKALLTKFEEIVKILLMEGMKQQRDRADFKAAKLLLKRGWYTRSAGVCGEIPGIVVGDCFHYRAEMLMLGLHRFAQGGVDYITAANSGVVDTRTGKPISVAGCIVTTPSASGDTDSEDGNSLIYVGKLPGGYFRGPRELKRGNLGLLNSFEKDLDVRIVRSFKLKYSTEEPKLKSEPQRIYFYDGLYRVQSWYLNNARDGSERILFTLIRNPGQAPLLSLQERQEAINMM